MDAARCILGYARGRPVVSTACSLRDTTAHLAHPSLTPLSHLEAAVIRSPL